MAEYAVPVEILARWKRNHEHIRKMVNQEVVGYDHVLTDLLLGLLGYGHILLEGVPGTAKTTTAKCFATTIGMDFRRMQFTQDVMPSDITGSFMLNPTSKQWELRKGPAFTNFLLADEINRAPPKTQSSMLETMEERQVTIEGQTFPMMRPFIVVATMNPVDSEGVYRLPEAQKDRFMLRTIMHYVGNEVEENMIKLKLLQSKINVDTSGRLKKESIVEAQDFAAKVTMNDETLGNAAYAAADKITESLTGVLPGPLLEVVKPALAIAWIEGRQAGGEEAKNLLDEALGQIRADMPTRSEQVVLYVDKAEEWRWRCVASNGRVVADSGEGYVRRIDALTEAQILFPGIEIAEGEESSG